MTTYQPHSLSSLIQRIGTFTYTFPSTSTLNALQAALHGWVQQDSSSEHLQCITCKTLLTVRIPESVNSDTQKALLLHFREQLHSEHKEHCPWKKYHSPESLYQIQKYDSSQVACFLKRYSDSLAVLKSTPLIKTSPDLTEDELHPLRSLVKSSDLEVNDRLLKQTLFGWNVIEIINEKIILNSPTDNRRIILANDINLVDSHAEWDCFVVGWENLLITIQAHVNGETEKINGYVEPMTDDTNDDDDVNVEEVLKAESEVNEGLELALNKLKELRKVYL